MKTEEDLGTFTSEQTAAVAQEFLRAGTKRLRAGDDEDDKCGDMITYQLVIFILFYVTLIVVIVCLCLKHRQECKQKEGGESNFMIV